MRDAAPAAEELATLSSISSLTAVELWYCWEEEPAYYVGTGVAEAAEASWLEKAEAAAAVWQLLPLKALSWSSYRIPAAVVQQIGMLQGLTRLELHIESEHLRHQLMPAQLAAMLQPLTGLQQLKVAGNACCAANDDTWCSVASIAEGPGYGVDAAAALLQAIGGLGELGEVCVDLQMHLLESEVNALCETVRELLPEAARWLVPHLTLNADVLSIDSGAYSTMP
jgi:hypothetical protein